MLCPYNGGVYRFVMQNGYTRAMENPIRGTLTFLSILFLSALAPALFAQDAAQTVQLPNGKLLGEVPGGPRPINNLPTAIAISPDGRFAVLLHSGYGAYSSGEKQSLSVLNLETNEIADFPDDGWVARRGKRIFWDWRSAWTGNTCLRAWPR